MLPCKNKDFYYDAKYSGGRVGGSGRFSADSARKIDLSYLCKWFPGKLNLQFYGESSRKGLKSKTL
jgi:hypothetical protein